MKEESKGELIGQMMAMENKIKNVSENVFYMSKKVDQLIEKLCKVDNEEYLRMIEEVQYLIGKTKGLLK